MRSRFAKAFLELKAKFEETMRRFEETDDLAERERLLKSLSGIVKETNTTVSALEQLNVLRNTSKPTPR